MKLCEEPVSRKNPEKILVGFRITFSRQRGLSRCRLRTETEINLFYLKFGPNLVHIWTEATSGSFPSSEPLPDRGRCPSRFWFCLLNGSFFFPPSPSACWGQGSECEGSCSTICCFVSSAAYFGICKAWIGLIRFDWMMLLNWIVISLNWAVSLSVLRWNKLRIGVKEEKMSFFWLPRTRSSLNTLKTSCSSRSIFLCVDQ